MFITCWFPDENWRKNKTGIFKSGMLLHPLRDLDPMGLQMVDPALLFKVTKAVNLFVILFYVIIKCECISISKQ